MLFAAGSFFLMPNTPSSAYFLNEDEKSLIAKTVLDEGLLTEGKSKRSDFTEICKTFVQPHVIFLALAGFFGGEFAELDAFVQVLTHP